MKDGTIDPLPQSLPSLQAGRAIAAILVVLSHNNTSIFAPPKYWGSLPFGRFLDFGDSGVKFFFVLSGFIILHAHFRDLNSGNVGRYLYKRFSRIYPVYWIVLALTLTIYFVNPQFGRGFETQPAVILDFILLIHLSALETVVGVAWTLYHEVLFYALFAMAIWRVKYGLVVIGCWLALSSLRIHLDVPPDVYNSYSAFYFSNLHLLFGFGMAAAWWLRRHAVAIPVIVLLSGVFVFLLAGFDQVYSKLLNGSLLEIVYGLGATLMILGAVELERGKRIRIPRLLMLLGDASYSIYLVHFIVLSALAKLTFATGMARLLPTAMAFLLLALLAVAAGTFFHLWIERPLLNMLRRKPRGKIAVEINQ